MNLEKQTGREISMDGSSQPSGIGSETTSSTTEGPRTVAAMPTDVADQLALYTRIMFALCIVCECILSFVCFTLELFAIHGIAGFCLEYTCEFIVNHLSRIRYMAAIIAICLGLLFDSYLRKVKYYAVLLSGVFLTIWPCLYLVIALPRYWKNQESKHDVFYWASIFHGLTTQFIGLLVFAQQFGMFLAGLALWICQGRRTLYACLMGVDIVLSFVYLLFWFFWARGFPTKSDAPYACVERTLMNSACYIVKKIDFKFCRGMAFRNYPGWQDYRCLHFSERTAYNTWGFLSMLLVLLPLVGYFVTNAGLNYLYLSQASILQTLEGEVFSLLAIKGAYFCILYPIFEYLIFPFCKNLIRNDVIRLLFLIGVGAFLLGVVVAICALIQQQCNPVEQDVINILSKSADEKFAHVVMVNLLDADVQVRGAYFNRIFVKPPNYWRTLKPHELFKILHVPMSKSPLNITVSCKSLRIYDDNALHLVEHRFNWFGVHPYGVFAMPVGTFHQHPEIGVNSGLFKAAHVNVLCRIPVCKGILEFRKNGRYHARLFFPMTHDVLGMQSFQLTGEYEIGFMQVGNKSSEITSKMTFEHLKVYLLVIKQNVIAFQHDRAIVDGKTRIVMIKASQAKVRIKLWVMNIPTFFQALASIFAEISLLEWLHIVCPRDLRAFIFSIPSLLTLIAYQYFMKVGAAWLLSVSSIKIFTYACTCWILLIVYGVSCLQFYRVWNSRHALHKKHKKTKNQDQASPGPAKGNAQEGQPSRVKDKES